MEDEQDLFSKEYTENAQINDLTLRTRALARRSRNGFETLRRNQVWAPGLGHTLGSRRSSEEVKVGAYLSGKAHHPGR